MNILINAITLISNYAKPKKVPESIEGLLSELKAGKNDTQDILIRVSEELSRVSSTSNQDNRALSAKAL